MRKKVYHFILYHLGGDRNLQLRLEISNDGEEAHQAYVTIKLPPYVYYENFTVVTSSTGHDVKCFTSSKGTKSNIL